MAAVAASFHCILEEFFDFEIQTCNSSRLKWASSSTALSSGDNEEILRLSGDVVYKCIPSSFCNGARCYLSV